jgi:excinuclease ABC subunit A
MDHKYIHVKGAKVHNLKNIDIKIPRNKFVVVTGLSGSGKSSLAFDTIYAEGQRRYVESLSTYARQFLEKLQKPDVEDIKGLSPSIAIEQRSSSGSLRSIVGTQTEIYDYLRLLFSRIGKPLCWQCSNPIDILETQQIIDKVLGFKPGTKVIVLAPLIKGKKGLFSDLFIRLKKDGFVRVRIDGKIYHLEEDIRLQRYKQHAIEVVVDRLIIEPDSKMRLSSSLETALQVAAGEVIIRNEEAGQEELFNTNNWCPNCRISMPILEPRLFSFNSPYGACPECNGLGMRLEFDPDLIIPDKTKSVQAGAIKVWKRGGRGYILYYRRLIRELFYELGVSLDTPFRDLPQDIQNIIIYGDRGKALGRNSFEGVIPHLERLFNTSESDYLKHEIAGFMVKKPCCICQGKRLKKESLSVFVDGRNIWDIMDMPIKNSYDFFNNIKISKTERLIAGHVIKEIKERLLFCVSVGLNYLTLSRLSSSLSGGEAQRIRLATQVGSALSGVIYILDEPTIGLHQRDIQKIIDIFKRLKSLGNTVIVVEHDERIIKSADWMIELGPAAGKKGGRVVYSGPVKDILTGRVKKPYLSKKGYSFLTADYLRAKRVISLPQKRRSYKDKDYIFIKGAAEHNLKNLDVKIPLGVFTCVTGVSGSGKSTLIEDILCKQLKRTIYGSKESPGKHDKIENQDLIDKIIAVDQTPIGRTPRSNPATYTNVYGYIRSLFSSLSQSKMRGFKPGRFSFNVKGGRCESCRGEGVKKIDMHFLPPVYVACEVCRGQRFNKETLEVRFKGFSIADVLNMTVDEAVTVFENIPKIKNILRTLQNVGLGYIELGQYATTLSGGEAQRVKLSKFLQKRSLKKTLYFLDEPTTGLHFEEVGKLLDVLQKIVDKGNTVVVIEHNPDVVKSADYLIDLGPQGGEQGGYLVAVGSPLEVIKQRNSYTGRVIKDKIKG